MHFGIKNILKNNRNYTSELIRNCLAIFFLQDPKTYAKDSLSFFFTHRIYPMLNQNYMQAKISTLEPCKHSSWKQNR